MSSTIYSSCICLLDCVWGRGMQECNFVAETFDILAQLASRRVESFCYLFIRVRHAAAFH